MSVTHRTGPCEPLNNPSLTFKYEPDHFQNHSFHAMEQGEHVLVTAHTGSGKTTVAEYAVAFGLKSKKKVIYTSPIKALSNQIFGDFSRKYPDWSLGIRTGDIDYRSEEAQVVIMTTEILQNMLYQQSLERTQEELEAMNTSTPNISFDDVALVIFDEVHYIKDRDRGSVWERSIMMMPVHIQMIMLSATLPDADRFCQWIAECKGKNVTHTTTPFRAVPLTHYVLTHKKKILIMDKDNNFKMEEYKKALQEYTFTPSDLRHYIGMIKLPALFFCFSKSQCQKYAQNLSDTSIVSKDETREIEKQFDHLLRRFKDYKDIESVSQTRNVKSLITRGVCFHHAGLLPPLKEIIQELFSKGLVKVLFVTETFAAGVNMPAKTVVFTGFQKYDDMTGGFRTLLPEEYGQMAGRAGRRGMDKIGTVIHLPFNAQHLPDPYCIREMMCGKISDIESRIKPDYHHIFNSIMYSTDVEDHKSMMQKYTTERIQYCEVKIAETTKLYNEQSTLVYDLHDKLTKEQPDFMDKLSYYESYHNGSLTGKSRKKYHKTDTEQWYNNNKDIVDNYQLQVHKAGNYEQEIEELQHELEGLRYSLQEDIGRAIEFLSSNQYLSTLKPIDQYTPEDITVKGIMASSINEVNAILLTELIMNDYFKDLNKKELVTILSIFLPSKDSERELLITEKISKHMYDIAQLAEDFESAECRMSSCISDWNIYTEYCDMTHYWIEYGDLDQVYLKTLSVVPMGEFIRMMIKLNNICRETQRIAQIAHKDDIVYKLQDSHELIIKGVAFPQSLYINTEATKRKN